MGDFLSKGPKSFSDYKPSGRSIVHPILGEFPIVQASPNGHSLLQKNINALQLEGSNKSTLRSHLLLTHPNIIRFEGYEQLSLNEYSVYFENFDLTLKQEIQNRAAAKTRFTEKEIVDLLRSISSALAYLEGNRIVHGQIRTETLVKVGSEYKLLNMTIFGNYKSTYQQALEEMRKTQIRLLSPQLQDALYNKIVDPVHEGYKDDVYALGVVILDVMTLCVDSSVPVPEKLNRATQLYSKTLLSVVNKMLEHIMSLRLDCISCSKVIENNYVQREIPPSLYTSKYLQRSSILRSSYRNEEPEQRLSTGVSMGDFKGLSPYQKRVERMPQQENILRGQDYRGSDYDQSPIRRPNISPDLGKAYEFLRPKETESVLANSYFQDNLYQSPQNPALGSRQTLTMKQTRSSSAVKNRYPGWESSSQNQALRKSGIQSDYNTGISTVKANVSDRNFSPLIKNDPLILSILSQDPVHNSPPPSIYNIYSKDTGSRGSAFQTTNDSGYEKPKSSTIYSTPDHAQYKPFKLDTGNKMYLNPHNPEPVRNQHVYSKPPLMAQSNHIQMNLSNVSGQPYSSAKRVQISLIQNSPNLSEPMHLDNSPIYAGYSQIEEDIKNENLRKNDSRLFSSGINFI